MNWKKRIIVDDQILKGKPVIKGTRLAVEFIVDLLANGWTNNEILRNYPNLTQEDIRACLAYAGQMLHEERVYHFVPMTRMKHGQIMGPNFFARETREKREKFLIDQCGLKVFVRVLSVLWSLSAAVF